MSLEILPGVWVYNPEFRSKQRQTMEKNLVKASYGDFAHSRKQGKVGTLSPCQLRLQIADCHTRF